MRECFSRSCDFIRALRRSLMGLVWALTACGRAADTHRGHCRGTTAHPGAQPPRHQDFDDEVEEHLAEPTLVRDGSSANTSAPPLPNPSTSCACAPRSTASRPQPSRTDTSATSVARYPAPARNLGGMGLGLDSSHQIAAAHDDTSQMHSAIREVSRFTVGNRWWRRPGSALVGRRANRFVMCFADRLARGLHVVGA